MESYENIFFMDQIVFTAMKKIKVNQNLVAVLEALKYNPRIFP